MCATPLVAGEAAPYSGQLLTPEAALRLSLRAEFGEAELKLELSRIEATYQLKLAHQEALYRVKTEALGSELAYAVKALETAQAAAEGHWWEHPVFVGTVASIIAIGLTGLVLWGAAELLPDPIVLR